MGNLDYFKIQEKSRKTKKQVNIFECLENLGFISIKENEYVLSLEINNNKIVEILKRRPQHLSLSFDKIEKNCFWFNIVYENKFNLQDWQLFRGIIHLNDTEYLIKLLWSCLEGTKYEQATTYLLATKETIYGNYKFK